MSEDGKILAVRMMHPEAVIGVGRFIVTSRSPAKKGGGERVMVVGTGLNLSQHGVKVSGEFDVYDGIMVFIPRKKLGVYENSPEDFLETGIDEIIGKHAPSDDEAEDHSEANT